MGINRVFLNSDFSGIYAMYAQNTLRNWWRASSTVVQEKEGTFAYIQNALRILCPKLLGYSNLLWQLSNGISRYSVISQLEWLKHLWWLKVLPAKYLLQATSALNSLQSKIWMNYYVYVHELLYIKYFASIFKKCVLIK